MPATKPIIGDWYDHPEFYDVSLCDETPLEAAFVEAACRKYCGFPVLRLLEPACGSGRLLTEMAARGYQVTGLDLNEKALAYLRKRLVRRRLSAEAYRADMADFRLPRPADAAYCMVNSFRHLLTEEAARRHLECVAEHLRPGGIYLLGLHLVPPDADLASIERWRTQAGQDPRQHRSPRGRHGPPAADRNPAGLAPRPAGRAALALPRPVRPAAVQREPVPRAAGERAVV